MTDRKGAWRRPDRVMLTRGTAKRAGKLGDVGEQLALAELSAHGFSSIKPLNHPKKNHPFADVYAERGGERFWISVRNPSQGGQSFRRKADGDSEGRRTVIPIDPGQP